jgi:16S rRNA (guanine1207-N2)-methyltransferase
LTQYFENNDSLKNNRESHQVIIKDQRYTFITDNGVFSKRGLDFGTRTLLETIPLDRINGNVLDVGCGYGPIGIFIKHNTNSLVDMIDVNNRSIELAKINADKNNVKVNIFNSDGYQNINKKYDFIITNPPVRVGKTILYRLLFDAKKYLVDNGELWLVINKNQGAKSLMKDLEKEYETKLIKKNKGFYIIQAINR